MWRRRRMLRHVVHRPIAAAGGPRPAIGAVGARGARVVLRAMTAIVTVAIRGETAGVHAGSGAGRRRWQARNIVVRIGVGVRIRWGGGRGRRRRREVAVGPRAAVLAVGAWAARVELGARPAIVAVTVGRVPAGIHARAATGRPRRRRRVVWRRRRGRGRRRRRPPLRPWRGRMHTEHTVGANAAVLAVLARAARVELGARPAIVAIAVGREPAGIHARAAAGRTGGRRRRPRPVRVRRPWRPVGMVAKNAIHPRAAVGAVGARLARMELGASATIIAVAIRGEAARIHAGAAAGRSRRWRRRASVTDAEPAASRAPGFKRW